MRQKIIRETFCTEEEFCTYRDQLQHCLREALAKQDGKDTDSLENEVTLLEIALNEAVNNAFKYAEDRVSIPAVTLSMCLLHSQWLIIRVKDSGTGFKANQVMTKLACLCGEEEETWQWGESGRGLFIMAQVMDKVRYNAKGNCVMLMKTLLK
ncbi:anti-sigma regulatory factor (Ser/Thr protein kinase) [Desulfitobacterium dichloroeliminans LMG P-21439]|uniref:Anti-sigma regulatory factor (Ser/Thr protein kinase) n=1 Tax=Desulfitobacterium dichloroeliminans (strain LMG P-21439 / DCA1) TaxID=871963 RepID=L0FD36_DESDL|nr:ATP-binding protein [Desulfitobacterium dichloroeliminans]AGA70546.1 anti-sigma regulatory factor (Ser/Thr protein kinase) [Desulfitobacterium dichloroeliminans LMG P-21439]